MSSSHASEHLKNEGTRLHSVIAGASAGLVSRFCVAPLDVIKIRLQLQIHSLSDPLSHRHVRGPVYKGSLSTLQTILRDEGFTALWKGNIPAEMMYVAYGATQFSVYRSSTAALHLLPPNLQLPDTAESFVAGAFAGAVATVLTYPLDLLRTRFAAQGTERIYTGLAAGVRDIARHEGLAGFFQGCTAALGAVIPYMGLFFAGYETFKISLADLPLPFGSSDAAAGMLASVTAKTGTYPLDVVRKRLQVQGPTRSRYVHTNIPTYKGIWPTVSTIVRTEGPRSLYRGLTISLIKAAPASAVTLWTYERVMDMLQPAPALPSE